MVLAFFEGFWTFF